MRLGGTRVEWRFDQAKLKVDPWVVWRVCRQPFERIFCRCPTSQLNIDVRQYAQGRLVRLGGGGDLPEVARARQVARLLPKVARCARQFRRPAICGGGSFYEIDSL